MTESVDTADPAAQRRAWSPAEIADQLGINYKAVLELIRSGELPALQIGRNYRVPDVELERYLRSARPDAQERAS